MKQILTYLLFALAVLFAQQAAAQLFVRNTTLSTSPSSLIYVNGDVVYAGQEQELITHQGTLEVKGRWYNLSSTDRKVFNDASNGNVLLSGDDQTINGLGTRFPNLQLTGLNGGKKTQNSDIEVKNQLSLSNQELDVNGHTARILSSEAGAVSNVSDASGIGYVNTSSNRNGLLIRSMRPGLEYTFPLGNKSGQNRYRPLVLSATSAGYVGAGFQHYSPGSDGYSISQKEQKVGVVNDLYYHIVKSEDKDNNIHLKVPFNTTTESADYNSIAAWQNGLWHNLASLSRPTTFRDNNKELWTTNPLALKGNEVQPIDIEKYNESTVHIPNIITPNGDGINDRFELQNLQSGDVVEITIVNRWQNVVFKSNSYHNEWDAKGLNSGVYFYTITVIGADGKKTPYIGYIEVKK